MTSNLAEQFQTLHEIVAAAKHNLAPGPWDYLMGGAETETTLRRNRLALDSLAFRPRVLRDVRRVDPTSTFFGRQLRLPVMLAPIGSLESFAPGGGATAAAGAAEFGVPQMLCSACNPGSRTPPPPPTTSASSSSTCAATTRGWTTTSSAPWTTATAPSA